jgi:peptidoglycan/LPS O-acetylase OafA/YrhL
VVDLSAARNLGSALKSPRVYLRREPIPPVGSHQIRLPAKAEGARPRSRSTYRADIQGLRAVAVLLVVLYHAGVPGIKGGYVGVDVFFVLSGYLITDLLLREHERTGRPSLLRFYARRARRILPMASLVLVATVVASYVLLGFIRAHVIAADGEWASVFGANFHFAAQGTNYLNSQLPPSPVQHYWSLAIEEQFYLVWPALVVGLVWASARHHLRRNLVIALVAIIALSFAWSVLQTRTDATWAYFSPFTRSWELALGALLAAGRPRLEMLPQRLGAWLGWSGLAGILVAAVAFSSSTAFPGTAAALPVVATALVVIGGAVTATSGASRVLGQRPLRFVGDISYSLYLWHWPLLIVFAEYVGHTPSVGTNLLLVLIAFVISYAGYRLVETPVRHAERLSSDPVAAVLLGACLVTVSLGISHVTSDAEPTGRTTKASVPAPARSTAQVTSDVHQAASATHLPSNLAPPLSALPADIPARPGGCNTETPSQHPKDCVYGDPNARQTVVMFGDSHAEMWMPALDLAARSAERKAILVSQSGCPAPVVHELDAQTQEPNHACDDWRQWAVTHIRSLHPQMVIVASMYFYPEDFDHKVIATSEWDRGLASVLRQLAMPGTQLVVLGDTPYMRLSPPDCLAAHPDDVGTCSSPRQTSVLAASNSGIQATARAAHALYQPVDQWFCDRRTCPAIVGRIGVYRDRAHMSATYAAWLYAVFGKAVGI